MLREDLMERISSEELSGWIAHTRSHDSDSWLQTAKVCQVIVAAFCGKATPLTDYLPARTRSERIMTEAEIRGAVNLL